MEQLSNWSSEGLEPEGRELASRLNGKVPLIYSSEANYSIAYNWKIKFNETGKIPAFYNVVPELNHNEMNGFDVVDRTRELSANFNFIFLRDSDDYSQIQKRFDVLKKLYTSRGLGVIEVPLSGTNPIEKMVRSLALADWTAVAIAEQYGLESEQVPMVEEFKRLIV
jgi:glucose/mannose-6-phosphate isomerase